MTYRKKCTHKIAFTFYLYGERQYDKERFLILYKSNHCNMRPIIILEYMREFILKSIYCILSVADEWQISFDLLLKSSIYDVIATES